MELTERLHDYNIDTTTLTLASYQRPGDAPAYMLRTVAHRAVTTWETLREFLPDLGYWPIIGWDMFKQPPWPEEPTADILAAAALIAGDKWFISDNMASTCAQELAVMPVSESHVSAFTFRTPFGRFTNTAPGLTPITLVPCTVPWKVPAFLRFSEDSNLPEEHVAVQKYWYERWGAELVSWSGAHAELRVARLPIDAIEVCHLAVEQDQYCPDLVAQNLGSVASLARILLHSRVWWFWWD